MFVKAILVQLIPEIFARCVELANAELEYYLFDRMLEITLRFLKNEEKMVWAGHDTIVDNKHIQAFIVVK